MFRKPKLSPPSGLPDPDVSSLTPIVQEYEDILERIITSGSNNNSVLIKYKQAMDDVIILNFDSISNFMDKEVYKHSEKNKKDFINNIKTATTICATGGWAVGRHWAQRDISLIKRLRNENNIDTDDVPADALYLLADAAYYPYWLLALVFNEYYDSPYGSRTRHQKDAHLKDTYQGIMKGVLMCFLDGVHSV